MSIKHSYENKTSSLFKSLVDSCQFSIETPVPARGLYKSNNSHISTKMSQTGLTNELAKTRHLLKDYIFEIRTLKRLRQVKIDADNYKDGFHFYMREICHLRDVVRQLREKEFLLMRAEYDMLSGNGGHAVTNGIFSGSGCHANTNGRKLVWNGN